MKFLTFAHMPRQKILFIAFLFMAFMSSCISNKKVVYLQDIKQSSDTLKNVYSFNPDNYKVRKHDVISVDIRTSDENANKLFNLPPASVNVGQLVNQGGGDVYFLSGYVVNDSGQIELPMIGKIKVAGLTLPEIRELVNKEVGRFFNYYFVLVRIGGMRYSILGEVNVPGKYNILQNQINIFEAISHARDLTILANRSNVKILRTYPDGIKIHEVNLLDQNIINSPFYYLQQNDIIYVEPLPVRQYGVGVQGFQTVTAVLSALSSTLLIFSSLRLLQQ